MEVLRCDHCSNDIEKGDDHWTVTLESLFHRFDARYVTSHLHIGCLSPWSLGEEIKREENA